MRLLARLRDAPPRVAQKLAASGCTLLISHLVCPSLSAQQFRHEPAFHTLRDSLARSSDTASLRHLLQRLRRTNHLLAGAAALRLGELGKDPDFSLARSSFRRAVKNERNEADAWYGLGLAEAGRSREEMRDPLRLGSRVGVKALQRSADFYHRALRVDRSFVPAALALAQVELSLLDTTRLRSARQALRRAVGTGSRPPPELLLAWGRLEWLGGDSATAAAAFERYIASGENRALGLLELARARLVLGQRSGEAAYYEGASLDDARAVAGCRADLEPIAADSSLRDFDRLTGARRAAFLHRFWTDRDHFELRSEGERLREHYRRLRFARLNFPLMVSRRFYGRLDAYRAGNTEIDDRGIVYLRQGEPAERLRPFVFGVMPNESWRYTRSDGDLLFHFSAGYDGNGGGDLYDYRLVQSVLDLRGAADAPRDQLILSRQSLSPVYSRMLNWGRFGASHIQARERNIGITSIEVGTTTDSYELHFARRLAAVADLVSVGRRDGSSLAHFVFGIDATGTRPRPTAGGVIYSVRVPLVVLDRHERSVATLDTTLAVRHARELESKEWLVGRAELILPGGLWSYRAALQQDDSTGVVLPRGSVRVAPTGVPFLGLSDIALGSPGRAVPWVTDARDTVLLAPSALFRREAEVQIYYEVTGAVALRLYRHEIAVFGGGNGTPAQRRPLVTLSFDEEAAGDVIRSRRTVRLERLKPGSYVVEVKLIDPDGRSQVRRRAIRILSGK